MHHAHLALCVAGTALAMVGHFPRVPRLWLPHAFGLAVMLALAAGSGNGIVKIGGILTLMVLGAFGATTAHLTARERLEGIADSAAMIALVALAPGAHVMAGQMAHMHSDGKMHVHSMPGMAVTTAGSAWPFAASCFVALVWMTVRITLVIRAAEPRLFDRPRRRELVNTAASGLMVAGMTLMSA